MTIAKIAMRVENYKLCSLNIMSINAREMVSWYNLKGFFNLSFLSGIYGFCWLNLKHEYQIGPEKDGQEIDVYHLNIYEIG